jgi:NAD(P)-dependent dehydrogenase (short-subunit alcohol dehydrogenase family)
LASLTDRVAIVTGGGDGIGRATSLLFSREGARIVVADISMQAAQQVAEEIAREKRDAVALTTDVTQKDSVQKMVEESLRRWGRIDILINIVGGSFPKPDLEMEEPEWDRVVNLNLKSVYLCCRAVLPAMAQRRYGKIVNLASAQAFSGSETRANYTAAKLGVVGFSKSLALEVIGLGINVNVVAPGLVATERVRSRFSEEEWKKVTSSRPMGRAVLPEEIAGAILFLVQDGQASVTGQIIHVNGGAVLV